MGHHAKQSVASRNTVLVLGCLTLIAGDLCYALIPSTLGALCFWGPAGRLSCAACAGVPGQAACNAADSAPYQASPALLTLRLPITFLLNLLCPLPGMIAGSTCVGIHMAMTQGVLFGLLSSYIPAQPLPGLGRIAGTAWSLTDLVLGGLVGG